MAQLEITLTTLKLDLTGQQITRVTAILTADWQRAQQEDVSGGPWPQAVRRLCDAFGSYRKTGKAGAVLKLSLTGYEIAVLAGLLSITIDRHEREHPATTDATVREICNQVIGYRQAIAAVLNNHETTTASQTTKTEKP